MQNAFSLFELLIVIAIIGILAAISYPIYTHHLARVHCKQAHIALLEMANSLEQEQNLIGSLSSIDIQQLIPNYARKLPYSFNLRNLKEHRYVLSARAKKPAALSLSCQIISISGSSF
jgi:type IV pilus assembly protein PilE